MQILVARQVRSHFTESASEQTEKIASKELADALNGEFKVLDISLFRTSLRNRSVEGKTLQKLKLELPQSRSPPAKSDGGGVQHTATVGFFLAEIGSTRHKEALLLITQYLRYVTVNVRAW